LDFGPGTLMGKITESSDEALKDELLERLTSKHYWKVMLFVLPCIWQGLTKTLFVTRSHWFKFLN
jgi:hypothetical protein